MSIRSFVVPLVLAVAAALPAQTVREVSFSYSPADPGFGTTRFDEISTAVVAATDGDLILVHPGVYSGGIDLGAKNLKIIGLCGPTTTTVYGANQTWGMRIAGQQSRETLIEGLSFEFCRGNPHGGGMRIASGSSPIVRRCHFQDCRGVTVGVNGGGGSGGAMLIVSLCSPLIEDCVFIANRGGNGNGLGSGGWGGAIAIDAYCDVEIRRSAFIDNLGGVGDFYCNPGICVVISYTAGGNGGAISVTTGSTLVCRDSRFVDNAAPGYGGSGGAVVASTSSSTTFERCRFEGNQGGPAVNPPSPFPDLTDQIGPGAGVGGALYLGGSAVVRDSFFRSNAVSAPGGAIANLGELLVEGSTFVDNAGSPSSYSPSFEYASFGATIANLSLQPAHLRGVVVRGSPSVDDFRGDFVFDQVVSVHPQRDWMTGAVFTPSGISVGDPGFADPDAGDFALAGASNFLQFLPADYFSSRADLNGRPREMGGASEPGCFERLDAIGNLEGTPGDDLGLLTGVNGAPAARPQVKGLTAGDILEIRLVASAATLVGATPYLAAEDQSEALDPVGGPFHLAFLAPVFLNDPAVPGATIALPSAGLERRFVVPAGLAGGRVVVQGAVAVPGGVVFSDAHRLEFE
ncbi:MAG: right-handed parallel beta-helix repeat-containing protein [Planctomycetota bacterium]